MLFSRRVHGWAAIAALSGVFVSSALVADASWYRAAAEATAAATVSGSEDPSSDPDSYPTATSDPAWTDNPPPTVPSGSAEVDVPAVGMVRAGELPLLVGAAPGGSPSRVLVTMLDQPAARALGSAFVVFHVARSDGLDVAGRVRVAVDYASLSRAVGGDFAARLALRRLPACALETPEAAECLGFAETGHRNDLTAQQLSAEVVTGPDAGALEPGSGPASEPAVYAMTTTASGQTGDYGASPLSGSDKWQVGVHTGNFSYAYPIPMPPAVAGPVPPIALTYSSQAVDGRTASQNNQASQVGEGWSFGAGHIERRFGGCHEDGQTGWADLCQGKSEYFLSLNGVASEMVRQSGSLWRLRDDPAWRIELLTQSPVRNGSQTGEYWIVTTPDGTRYWFGLGYEPNTGSASVNPLATRSAWNVPVFGDDPNEPCHNPASVALSSCYQTWRWNVDRIQDTKSNVATLFYTNEQNRYARNGNPNLSSVYDRSGYLTRVEYSQRSGTESAAHSIVQIAVADRCGNSVNNGGACGAMTVENQPDYPDVPLDLHCTSTSCSGEGQRTPTFWTTKYVTRIETFIWDDLNGDGTYGTEILDRIVFSYTFPSTHETGTSPSLWLRKIARTGLRGGKTTELPLVDLDGGYFANRVDSDPANGIPAIHKYRLTSIIAELDGQIVVGYANPLLCDRNYARLQTGAWDANERSCFPQEHTPRGSSQSSFGVFHKYHATRVELRDLATQGPAQITNYRYLGGAAWRHEDSLVSTSQTWSDYRGHAVVDVLTGPDVNAPLSITEHRVYRGMHGDRLVGGGTRSAVVTDGDNTAFQDTHYLAGRPLETTQKNLDNSPAVITQHRYGATATANGPAGTTSVPHNAQYVREVNTFTHTRDLTIASPRTYQTRRVDRTYDPTYGLVTTSYDRGDLATTADDTCTKPVRTANTGAWIIDAVHREETLAGDCSSTTVIGRVETFYDDALNASTMPSYGYPTAVSVWADGVTTLISRTGYDSLGRVTATKTPRYEATTIQTVTRYNPAGWAGYPTSVTVTKPNDLVTTSRRRLDQPGPVTDANNQTTSPEYDGLGRLVTVTRPLDPPSTPGIVYAYEVDKNKNVPAYVRSRRLQNDTTYLDSYTYLDGWGRERESQTLAPSTAPTSSGGRILTTTRYDERGNVAATSQPFHRTGAPGSGYVGVAAGQVPREQRFGYDPLNRRNRVAQWSSNAEQWHTATTHWGAFTQVDAYKADGTPARGRVIHRHDALGRVRQIEESLGTNAVVVTKHDYDRRGRLDKITDDAGNVTSYTFDWAGRRLTSSDPDQGGWTYTYDDNGNLTTVLDSPVPTGSTQRQWRVTNTYDELDRRTAQSSTLVSGPPAPAGPSATWSYDHTFIPSYSLGRLTGSTRTVNGETYTINITFYDERGRPQGRTVDLPDMPGLPSTHTVDFAYDQADRVIRTVYPPDGILAGETVETSYNNAGLPSTLTSDSATYVSATLYEPDGQLAGRDLGGTGLVTATRRYTYEPAAGRLASTVTTAAGVTGNVEQTSITYDTQNNVTSVRDGVVGQSECFGYDNLNRLNRAYTTSLATCGAFDALPAGSAPYNLTYTYDELGNITRIQDTHAQTDRHHKATGRPHALTDIGTAAGLDDIETITYDANGAMDTRTGSGRQADYDFDALHKMTSATTTTGGITRKTGYVYDADGNRLRVTEDPNTTVANDHVDTFYVNGMEYRVAANAANPAQPTVTATRYYGGLAMRTTEGTGTERGLWWLVSNNQGSAVAAIDADDAGIGVRRQRYLPYGERRPNGQPLPTEKGFLGRPEDEVGLVHLGARHYDSSVGRFVSVDPVVSPGTPASLNPYIYAYGNPTSLTDPTGLTPACEESGVACLQQQLAYQETQAQANATMSALRNSQAYQDLAVESAAIFYVASEEARTGKSSELARQYRDLINAAGLKAAAGETLTEFEAVALSDYASLSGETYSDPTQDKILHWGVNISLALGAVGVARAVLARVLTAKVGVHIAAHGSAHVLITSAHGASHTAAFGGKYTVYVAQTNGQVTYVGMTKAWAARVAAHAKAGRTIQPYASNLSYIEARGAEQILIDYHGLGRLDNLINSVALKNPRFQELVTAGWNALAQRGLAP